MPSFDERIAAMKAQQEAADKNKKEEAEKAAAETAEQAKQEKRGELSNERESVAAELAQAEQNANEAANAIAQAEAFMAEQGENLAPEAKAEIDAVKAEAAEATQKFEAFKAELARIESELSALDASAPEQVEAPQEVPVAAEAPQEAATVETAAEESVELPKAETTAPVAMETKPEEIDTKAAFDTLFKDARTRISELKYGLNPNYEETRQAIKENKDAEDKFVEELIAEPDKIAPVLEAMRQRAETSVLDVDKVTKLRGRVAGARNDEWKGRGEEDLDEEQRRQQGKLEERKREINSCLDILEKLKRSGSEKVKVEELQQTAKKMLEDYAKLAEDFDVMAPEQGVYATQEAANIFLDHPQLYQDTEFAKRLLTRREELLKTASTFWGTYDEKLDMFGEPYQGQKLREKGTAELRRRAQNSIRNTRERITKIEAGATHYR